MIREIIEGIGNWCADSLGWMVMNVVPILLVLMLFVGLPFVIYCAWRAPSMPDRGLCLAGHQERVVVNTSSMIWAGKTMIMVPTTHVDIEWACQQWERP